MRRIAAIFLCVLLMLSGKAFSQFGYDRIEDDLALEFGKPIEFTGTPRINRVEGLHLNLSTKIHPARVHNLRIYADAGVGFWNQDNKRITYRGGVRKDFFDFQRLTIGAEVFKKVESRDDWVVADLENSVAAFLFGQDYRDYFGSQGAMLYIDNKFINNHIFRFELARREYDFLRRNIDWSVFDQSLPENPRRPDAFIGVGDETSLRFIFSFDWRDNPIFPLTGWLVDAIYEHTEDDFDTDGLFVTVKRFQQMFENQRLLVRAMLGTRSGNIRGSDSLGIQHTIDLGGVGTLRGFDDKEFSGNRFFMINANYLFNGDILQRIPLQNVPYFGNLWTVLSLGAFVDTGWAYFTDNEDGVLAGISDLKPGNWKTDAGLSLLVLEGIFRLDVAKRMDRSRDDFRVSFRLLQNF